MLKKSTCFAGIAALFCGLLLASCQKFSGSQTIPAYIHIDSITVDCDYYTYGANTCNFTDAWVYVDAQNIGCYELPATFPILERGKHKISIYGGIKVNGIGAARSPYPFCKPRVYEDFNLVEDSIITLQPVLNYYPVEILKTGWKEDFEQGSTLMATSQSDTSLMRVGGTEAWRVDSVHSFYSGKIVLPGDSLHFTVASSDEMTDLPTDGSYCMLEMDYKSNDTFTVGVMYFQDYTLTQWPLVTITPTDTQHAIPENWKKIYINIGPTLVANEHADYFKIYLTSHTDNDIPASYTRYFYFDNLKLLYR